MPKVGTRTDRTADAWDETAISSILLEVVRTAIGAPALCLDDDFWDYGMTSIGLMEVASRMSSTLQADVPPTVLFEHPTVAAAARAVAGLDLVADPMAAILKPIASMPSGADLPLTFNQVFRIARSARPDGGFARTHRPACWAAEIIGDVNGDVFLEALRAVVSLHAALRVHFQVRHDGEVRQIVSPTPDVALEVWDDVLGDAWLSLFRDTVQKPFDLGRGPLHRAGLARAHDGRSVCWLIVDHSLVDAVSLTLIGELLYHECARGLGLDVPSDPTPPSYEAWVEQVAAGPATTDVEYWRSATAHLDPYRAWDGPLRIPPGDEPLEPTQHRRVILGAVDLGPARERWARSNPLQPTIDLLSAFTLALHARFQVSPVTLFVPVSNRAAAGHAGVVGSLAGELPLILDVRPVDTVDTLAPTVERQLAGVLDHQALPIDALQRILHFQQAEAHDPSEVNGRDYARVSLNLLPRANVPFDDVPGLTMTPLNVDPTDGDLGSVSGMVCDVVVDDSQIVWDVHWSPAYVNESTVVDLIDEIVQIMRLQVR